METRETIMTQVQAWANKHLRENFDFRPYQKEAITITVENVLKGTKLEVMNAPTGSGKSLIAMISCGVLYEYYGLTSYILVSDLSLFDQYVADFEKYGLTEFGFLKGKDNYLCDMVHDVISNGQCTFEDISPNDLEDPNKALSLGFPCSKTCEYMQCRKKAKNSPITLMTYQLYFMLINGSENNENASFKKRSFIIGDECHKLQDIAQNLFSPSINTAETDWLKTLAKFAQDQKIPMIETSVVTDAAIEVINTENQEKLVDKIRAYVEAVKYFADLGESVAAMVKASKNKKALAKELRAARIAQDKYASIDMYLKLVDDYGPKCIVKTNDDENTKCVINCAYEGKLVAKYFHNKSGSELLMSATIGEYNTYKQMIGANDMDNKEACKYVGLPSLFNFDNSPIYYSKVNKMSFREKAKSIGPVCEEIKKICTKHKDQRGIIQTGSYEFANALKERLPADIKKRCIFYINAKDKNLALEKFEKTSNGILIGPTLLEGLNFDGDKCRFSICMKLPYANLKDKLVKAKMELIPDYYSFDVIGKLEQGFGRGVRYDGDWCVNYILDGCIMDLFRFNKNKFSREVIGRFKEYK